MIPLLQAERKRRMEAASWRRDHGDMPDEGEKLMAALKAWCHAMRGADAFVFDVDPDEFAKRVYSDLLLCGGAHAVKHDIADWLAEAI